MNVKGKTLLLTGATGGIGRAIAHEMIQRGANLIVTGRNQSRLDALVAELGTACITVVADVVSTEGRARIVDAARCAVVDIVVHNAGGLEFGLLDEQAEDDLEQMIRLNLLAPALLTRQLIPLLEKKPSASLVFIGSTFGSIGHPGFVMYCASKFGLRGFVEGLRRELADTGITVHYLAPRATKTKLNTSAVIELNESLGNSVDAPEVVARELVALLDASRGQNRFLGWPEKLLVRINSLFPRLIDSALAKKLETVQRFARVR